MNEYDILDELEFNDLMQSYRHASITNQKEVIERFEAVKAFIREHKEYITNEFLVTRESLATK